jgi:O-antigen/teichoic acid export membrane protein
MSQYRSLDRSTNVAILFASLLVATMIFGSVATAFGHLAQPALVSDQIEEVVVQG